MDVQASFCRAIEEEEVVFICKVHPSLMGDTDIVFVRFIGDEDFDNVNSRSLFNSLQPFRYISERLFSSAVVNEDDAMSPVIVTFRNAFEAFLASSIPNVELDLFSTAYDVI